MKNNGFDLYEGLILTEDQKRELEEQEVISKIIIEMIDKRIKLNMTQRDLAKISGIKQPMIARIERMDVTPRFDTIIRLSKALGLDLCFSNKIDLNVNVKIEIEVQMQPRLFAFDEMTKQNITMLSC